MIRRMLFVCFILLCGCSYQPPADKLSVVASLFPQYDFARQVAGDKADVTLLLPPGIESHTFDPRPEDILKISRSQLFLYTGEHNEPWAKRVVDGIESSLTVADLSQHVVLKQLAAQDGHDHDLHDKHEFDPHIWLDPANAIIMVTDIAAHLSAIDADNAQFYNQNANSYIAKLRDLDNQIQQVVTNSRRDTVVFAGKFAYMYFLDRYNLKYETAYESCSTEGEPSVARVGQIIEFVKHNQIPCVYHEEFVLPRIANTIAEQTGATPLLFSTAHNVTAQQLADGVGYIDIMLENLENLKKGIS